MVGPHGERPVERGAAGELPWETSVLGWLAYPANLAFAGIAAFVLALPLVTALSAAIAVGVALDRWRDGDETGVFTRHLPRLAGDLAADPRPRAW